MTDCERLTERVEALERKVAKLRQAASHGLGAALGLGIREVKAESGLVGAVVFGGVVCFLVVWMLKEPGRDWWDPKW